MTMNCPVCKTTPLQSMTLEQQLKASSCSDCQGQWIGAVDYWQWLERHGETLPEKEPDSIPLEVADSQKAKLCPECRRIMLRYKVGHGLTFTLDQCSSCNGIWFDANEWDALRQRNLHDEVHLVFSAPWQAQVRREESRQVLAKLYTEWFQHDYDKIKTIKEWIEQHPQQEKATRRPCQEKNALRRCLYSFCWVG